MAQSNSIAPVTHSGPRQSGGTARERAADLLEIACKIAVVVMAVVSTALVVSQ